MTKLPNTVYNIGRFVLCLVFSCGITVIQIHHIFQIKCKNKNLANIDVHGAASGWANRWVHKEFSSHPM